MSNKTKKAKLDERNITVWESPTTMFESQYGYVPYRTWCQKEIVRMRRNGGKDRILLSRRTPTGAVEEVAVGRK